MPPCRPSAQSRSVQIGPAKQADAAQLGGWVSAASKLKVGWCMLGCAMANLVCWGHMQASLARSSSVPSSLPPGAWSQYGHASLHFLTPTRTVLNTPATTLRSAASGGAWFIPSNEISLRMLSWRRSTSRPLASPLHGSLVQAASAGASRLCHLPDRLVLLHSLRLL